MQVKSFGIFPELMNTSGISNVFSHCILTLGLFLNLIQSSGMVEGQHLLYLNFFVSAKWGYADKLMLHFGQFSVAQSG